VISLGKIPYEVVVKNTKLVSFFKDEVVCCSEGDLGLPKGGVKKSGKCGSVCLLNYFL